MPKKKSSEIKDHEVARLASMLQKKYGAPLARLWNGDGPPIHSTSDCRAGFVEIIKYWREEMGRDGQEES